MKQINISLSFFGWKYIINPDYWYSDKIKKKNGQKFPLV